MNKERGFFVKTENKKTRPKGIKTAAFLIFALFISALIIYLSIGRGESEQSVQFKTLEEKKIPADITADVIPEYKSLERALACKIDDDIYVIVTRGEKPTSGFGVMIDKMVLEEKEEKTNLIVYAAFDDPQQETAISQIITYPVSVVKTDLKRLPDSIELRIQY